ncbi:glycoside hydrolase [Candidatus Saccharibacteria bacterium CG_4_10_14_0_2_um_filter_52_9]|nr:MAG: glycoside hydrolase [Candidatus Saccharibacteria bacterium CG_4_10_14_0_2_um_filter_52_9]
MQDMTDLLEQAKAVLDMNDRGNYTQPAHGLYPHQWLWDSCFTAIGLRHLDVERAQKELISLLRGQWHNGMLPNIIFRDEPQWRTDRNIWRSWLNPQAPDDVMTTGITQPPMLAEAIVKVGAKMEWPERHSWYRKMYPALLEYHQWLYNDRDPHHEGLVLQIHPWEVGLDSTPPWLAELHGHRLPLWIRVVEKTKFDRVINLFRRDTHSVPSDQRFPTIEALAVFDIQRRLRRKSYAIDKVLDHSMLTIEDLSFNSIFIRANSHLRDIAKSLQEELPADLVKRMAKTEETLEELWDPYSGQYYSRDFITHRLLKVPSIATLLPLYAGSISQEKADQLVKMLENEYAFGPAYPVPSVPVNSFWFQPKRYWQGPSWVNTNWLIIDGLKRYGFKDHAAALRESTMEMVAESGCYEYFDPLSGEGVGAENFSWTAALAIDLLKTKK